MVALFSFCGTGNRYVAATDAVLMSCADVSTAGSASPSHRWCSSLIEHQLKNFLHEHLWTALCVYIKMS